MQEQFENKLTEKIKSTFNYYEEPYNEAAWIKMKDKLQKNDSKKIIFWINFSKAAAILLILGISTVIFLKLSNNSELKPARFFSEIQGNTNSRIFKSDNSKDVDSIKNNNDVIDDTSEKFNQNHIENNIAHNDKNNNNKINQQQIADENDNQNNLIADDEIIINNQIDCTQVVFIENIDEIIDSNQQVTIDNSVDCVQIILEKYEIDESIFEQNNKKNKKKDKTVTLGLALASNYSYSSEYVSDNVNFGGGITGDFRIFKNLSINTGIIFGNQSMELGSNKFLAADEAFATDNLASEEINQSIQLMSLDIPVNVQYDIKNFFVSAGVSSYTYLSEKYEYSYFTRETLNVANGDGTYSEENALIQSESETNINAFQRFDLAKLFNFSIGYSLPLKKGKIIFEPFIKYPLGNLSSGDIAFGLGGFSLKYKF